MEGLVGRGTWEDGVGAKGRQGYRRDIVVFVEDGSESKEEEHEYCKESFLLISVLEYSQFLGLTLN